MRIAATADVVQTGDADRRPPAVAVVLADRASPLGLPLIAYGLIFNLGSRRRRRRRARRRHLRLGPRAVDRRGRPATTPTTTTATTTSPTAPRAEPTADAEPDAGRADERGGPRWLTPRVDRRRPRARPRAQAGRPRLDTSTGVSNEKLGMWVFLGSECLLFGGADLDLPALQEPRCPRQGPTPHDALRHPVHVGELVRAADELAHDGAGRSSAIQRGDHAALPHLAAHHRAARRDLHLRPGLRVHRASCRRAWATPPTSSARPSSRSPASTASTSPSAS